MSGKWKSFFLIISAIFGFLLITSAYPLAFRELIADVLGVGIWALDVIDDTIVGQILAAIVVIGILFTMVGGAYLALEQIYLWIKNRQDDTVNEYQIK